MQLTPSGAFEHIKESIIQYLETAYRISTPPFLKSEVVSCADMAPQLSFRYHWIP